MKKYENFNKAGMFFITPDKSIHGQLTLDGSRSLLELHSDEHFQIPYSSPQCITGVLGDKTKVTLIDCILKEGTGSGSRNGDRYYYAKLFPHFVLIGDKHINDNENVIKSINMVVDDGRLLFHENTAFGSLIDATPYIDEIVSIDSSDKQITTGSNPSILYYTGKSELFKSNTSIGKIVASNRTSGPMFMGSHGLKLSNEIVFHIDFDAPVSFSRSISNIAIVRSFIEIICGRPQNIECVSVALNANEDFPIFLDVYWCMPPKRSQNFENSPIHPADILIDAGGEPKYFSKILSSWIKLERERRDSRFRFSQGFQRQRHYTIDRLVGAANMFDILPKHAVGLPKDVSKEVTKAIKQCKGIIKSLPESSERDAILSSLGFVGRLNLKQKIKNRAQPILSSIGHKLPEFEKVIDQAVNCRNYYVHGNENTKIEYSAHVDLLMFFTDTLEFIFAISELIESGWEVERWIQGGSVMSHPFAEYIVNYTNALKALKDTLKNQ